MIRRINRTCRFRLFVFFALAVFVVPLINPEESFSQPAALLSPDAWYNYAAHCFEAGDYRAAASAYQQFIYFFPEDERTLLADYQTGLCDFHEKFYTRALSRFIRIFDENALNGVGLDAAFMISRCHRKMGDFHNAASHLLYLLELTKNPAITDRAHYELGWLYLESGRFDAAREMFSNIRLSQSCIRYQTHKIGEYLSAKDQISRKSPVVAGFFSIIPGGGYLYCGRYRDALVALLINGALGIGAAECFAEDLEAVGGMMAVLGIGFYGGSIYGGISSVHKFNRLQEIQYVEDLKKRISPGLGFFMQDAGPGIVLSWRF